MTHSDAVIETAGRLEAAGIPFALVTVVRCVPPTSAKPGAKAVVKADGAIHGWIGGGCAQPAVVKVSKQAILDGRPRLIRISPGGETAEEGVVDFGMPCHSGGTLDIFIDPVVQRPVLLVVGASPLARALTGLARGVGLRAVAAFPGADAQLFPEADQVLDGFDKIAALDPAPEFVVVATQGQRDERGLETALATRARHIAFVASRRKWEKLRSFLKERGHDPARVDGIVAPAGIDIGAATPEEIALSVLAGVVRARRAGTAGAAAAGDDAAPPEHPAGRRGGGRAVDPVCGMSVDLHDADHASEYGGSIYYFCCAGCKQTFDRDPSSYLQTGERAG